MSFGELPRLTRSIRAFSDLDHHNLRKLNECNIEQLKKKKLKERNSTLTWSDVRNRIEKEAGPKSQVLKQLNELRLFAKELSGGDQSKEVVDEAAVFLLQSFLGERVVSRKLHLLLKQMFGTVSSNTANKVVGCVSNITVQLNDQLIELLKSGVQVNESKRKMFGAEMEYNPDDLRVPYIDTSFLVDLSSRVGVKTVREFSMDYDNMAASLFAREDVKKPQKKNGYGRLWLETEINKFYNSLNSADLSVEEFLDSIITLLKSGRTNDELQNELFDLLGFNMFELIQILLEHRNDIVLSATVAEEKKMVAAKAEARAHGVGYYGFSSDEAERRTQQEALGRLRQETTAKQQLAQEARQRRQQQMAARLKAARDRQRARLGLPPEEDEPETPAPEKEEEEEPSAPEMVQSEEIPQKTADLPKKVPQVRPWDIGKEGVAEHQVLSQEEWVKKRRDDRLQEFAPPVTYVEDTAPSGRPQKAPRKWTSHKLFQKKQPEQSPDAGGEEDAPAPPPAYLEDMALLGPEPTMFFTTKRQKVAVDASAPSGSVAQHEEQAAARTGVEIAPPPTYEYYGPSGSTLRKDMGKKDMESAIVAGLKYLRKHAEDKEAQREKGLLPIL